MQIYLHINGQQVGPYTSDQLQQLLDAHQISGNTAAWHEGLSEWSTASNLLQSLRPQAGLPPRPPLPPPVASLQRPAPPAFSTSGHPAAKSKLSLGCWAGLVVAGVIALLGIAIVIWLCSLPKQGVLLKNEMEPYALKYLKDHQVLMPSEDLIAYFDETLTMDGSEAAIITTQRVIYLKDGQADSIDLKDIQDIKRSRDTLNNSFEIYSTTGKSIKIDIPRLNGAATFSNALDIARQRAANASSDTKPNP